MLVRILFSCIILFWANTALAASSFDFTPPNVLRATLQNGLEVVVIPDRRAPVVTHMMWYKVGSADEPAGKSGIAHFLEHLMFKGTRNIPAGEFSRKVAEIGGEENAFTTVDFTVYYQKISPDALEMVMDYEADRMENLVLNDAVVEPEKKVILEERRSRVASSPSAILREIVDTTLFTHHPYGNPIIGWEHEMLQLTRHDAIEFYNRYYSPNNAILVVAGDVEPKAVLTSAKKIYGKVDRRVEKIVQQRVLEPEPVAARTVEYADARVTRPNWQRVYLVPSYNLAQEGEAEALDLLADLLGGAITSRIYRHMVVEAEVATSAGSWFQGAALEQTRFGLYATPRGEHTLGDVERVMDEIVEELVNDGITPEELSRAKSNLLKTVIFERDSQTTMARLYGTVLALGGDVKDADEWPQKVNAVTIEMVNAAARKFLKINRSVTSYLRPKT